MEIGVVPKDDFSLIEITGLQSGGEAFGLRNRHIQPGRRRNREKWEELNIDVAEEKEVLQKCLVVPKRNKLQDKGGIDHWGKELHQTHQVDLEIWSWLVTIDEDDLHRKKKSKREKFADILDYDGNSNLNLKPTLPYTGQR